MASVTYTYTTVNGKTYYVVSDSFLRSTKARDILTGETKTLREGGYLTNNLSIRKAIASAFGLPTFKK